MPAKSKAQQRFFGLVRSVQKGDTPRKRVGKKVRDAADNISHKDVIDFASTKTKKLPETVTVTETQLRQLIREAVSETIKESFRGERGLDKEKDDNMKTHDMGKQCLDRELRHRVRMMSKWTERDAEQIGDAWEDMHENKLRRIVRESVDDVLSSIKEPNI